MRFCAGFLVILITAFAPAHGKSPLPSLRWAEGEPGCSFRRGNDGKYYYGMSSENLDVLMTVDSQELEMVRRRLDRLFAVQLRVRYRGPKTLGVEPDKIRLKFLTHFGVVHPSLDPDEIMQDLQSQADAFTDYVQHEISKHPDKKTEKEALLQNYRTDVFQLMDFVCTRSLRPAKLDLQNPEIEGWVFFSTTGKWVGKWKTPEHFLLRVSVGKQIFEFPFTLPASEGDLILRRRSP